jgi:hypothetical protein
MTTKYDYISTCCNTGYSEIRDETQPQVYTTCVQCGQGAYDLVAETQLDAVGAIDTPPSSMDNGAPSA